MIPWEHRGKLGPARAFWETLVLSVRAPRYFYGLAPREDSVWGALAYGLAFEVIVALVSFAHHALFGAAELQSSLTPFYPQIREAFPEGPSIIMRLQASAAIVSLLLTPLTYLFNLLVTVTMTWIGLKMAGAMTTSYARLLKMFAYASWISIFGVLGVPSEMLLGLLSFVLILGFGAYYWTVVVRETQRVDTTRIVVASLYSCLVGGLFCCFIGVPGIAGLAYAVYKMLPPFSIAPPS